MNFEGQAINSVFRSGKGVIIMVDVARTRFPDDMTRSLHLEGPSLESAASEAMEKLKDYARDQPIAFGLWAFGIGFVLGWRLKPW
jgi:hypothetical protein